MWKGHRADKKLGPEKFMVVHVAHWPLCKPGTWSILYRTMWHTSGYHLPFPFSITAQACGTDEPVKNRPTNYRVKLHPVR